MNRNRNADRLPTLKERWAQLKKHLAELKETLAPMSWEDRMDHLWEYYKLALVPVVLVVAIVATVIVKANEPDVLFEGVVANVVLSEETDACITDEWMQILGGDPKNEVVRYSEAYFGDMTNPKNSDELQYAQKPLLLAAAQELEYVIMDKNALTYYLAQEMFVPLADVLTQEQIQQLEVNGQLFYVQEDNDEDEEFDDIFAEDFGEEDENEEDGVKYPAAVVLTETEFGKACRSADDVYIAFPGNTENAELSDDFLMYLLNWKATE